MYIGCFVVSCFVKRILRTVRVRRSSPLTSSRPRWTNESAMNSSTPWAAKPELSADSAIKRVVTSWSLDHLFVRRDDEPGFRDVHRVFCRVVLREAHLADSEGSAKLALDLLEAQMDERIGDELLDPMGREAGAVRRLCNQEGRDVLVPRSPFRPPRRRARFP